MGGGGGGGLGGDSLPLVCSPGDLDCDAYFLLGCSGHLLILSEHCL